MSRNRRSMTRVLEHSSKTELLSPKGMMANELLFAVATCLLESHSGFSLKATRVVAAPAKENKQPRFLRPLFDGKHSRSPRRELVRRVSLQGLYGFLADPEAIPVEDKENEGSGITPHGVCEFSATCGLYFHSRRWKWELGIMRLGYSDEGWHEPVTKVFHTATTVVGGEYRMEIFKVS